MGCQLGIVSANAGEEASASRILWLKTMPLDLFSFKGVGLHNTKLGKLKLSNLLFQLSVPNPIVFPVDYWGLYSLLYQK